MSMFRRDPTPTQRLMIALMVGAFTFLLLWLIPELIGIFDPATEDTFSEWVFDLSFGPVLFISILFAFTGMVFVWAGGHFIEGYRRRRRAEQQIVERLMEPYDLDKDDDE